MTTLALADWEVVAYLVEAYAEGQVRIVTDGEYANYEFTEAKLKRVDAALAEALAAVRGGSIDQMKRALAALDRLGIAPPSLDKKEEEEAHELR